MLPIVITAGNAANMELKPGSFLPGFTACYDTIRLQLEISLGRIGVANDFFSLTASTPASLKEHNYPSPPSAVAAWVRR